MMVDCRTDGEGITSGKLYGVTAFKVGRSDCFTFSHLTPYMYTMKCEYTVCVCSIFIHVRAHLCHSQESRTVAERKIGEKLQAKMGEIMEGGRSRVTHTFYVINILPKEMC